MVPNWPKISIVIPTRNQAQYIAETFDSLLSQSYPNLELIVMDGGSTDGTLEVVNRYASHVAHVESRDDGGQCYGVAKGLEYATGDIMAYLNSDDVLLPGALYAVAAFMRKDPTVEWVTGGCIRFSSSSDHPIMRPRPGKHLYEWLLACTIYEPSTFWKRSALEKVGSYPTDCRYSHDWHMWLLLASKGVRCALMERPLSGFRVHETSATVSQQKAIIVEDEWIRKTFEPMLSPWERVPYLYQLRRLRSFWALRDAETYLNEGSTGQAREKLRECVAYFPPSIASRSYRSLRRRA